jgi:hypothetical protein
MGGGCIATCGAADGGTTGDFTCGAPGTDD